MAKAIKVCRVCGKEYEACVTRPAFNTFRWQDVACSPECGSEYLRRIMISRGQIQESSNDIQGGVSSTFTDNDNSPSVEYNEEYNGFNYDGYEEVDEIYENGFGAD